MIFHHDTDRLTYLELLRQYCDLHRLSLLAYCLMSNHVHLVVIPRAPSSLAQALKQAHGRYAAYWNARQCSSGHVWQGRFYSCPLDEAHLWMALRYVELNPVRAGLVPVAWEWRWSSASAHCGTAASEIGVELEPWKKRWKMEEWTNYLEGGESPAEMKALRQFTHTGRPLGSATDPPQKMRSRSNSVFLVRMRVSSVCPWIRSRLSLDSPSYAPCTATDLLT